MPEASVDPGYGSLRRKVTLACDYCRKKRVKCTGSAPCKLCAENRHPCHFDDRNRNRRGPRPRANSSRPSRICLIAPAPSRPSDRHVDQISSFSGGEYLPSSPNVASSIKNVATNDLDDEDPDSEEDVFPPATEWRGGLLSVLMDPSTPDSFWNTVDPDVCAHLVELFYCRSSSLLGLIVPADELIEKICAGTCTRSLLLAICAYSVRFSVHKAVKEPSASKLAKDFERSARYQVDLSSAPGSEPSMASTYCVLIEYSIGLGDGRQAWMDLALAKTAPQLFVEERLHRCQASAVAICTICKELVWQRDFFRNIHVVGYACMQSAIVLVNYLHRASRPHSPWIADTLKFIFVALGAASSFYPPANDWIKVLIRVHDINVSLKNVSGSSVEDVFSTYFSRYVDIKEPEWVPLIPSSVSYAQGRLRRNPVTALNVRKIGFTVMPVIFRRI
ncbi:hypothetical protein CGMCC3_g1225 [Colletotrichum fructicola]|nr:uncharacterized protein CGMCC3_g1225 [Colletotrichum fructicola]KAE9582886.1 hypothetical protein CGMCC3_g1225 [Colletotrichum fructicola]